QAVAMNSPDAVQEALPESASLESEGVGAVMDPSGVVSLRSSAVEQADPQESEAFLAQLKQEAERRRKYFRVYNAVNTVLLSVFLLGLVNAYYGWFRFNFPHIVSVSLLFTIVACVVTSMWRKTMEKMAQATDITMIGPLLKAFVNPSGMAEQAMVGRTLAHL